MRLKYLGGAFLPGVPARDLSEEEAEAYGGVKALLATGLYIEEQEDEKKEQATGKKTAAKDGK